MNKNLADPQKMAKFQAKWKALKKEAGRQSRGGPYSKPGNCAAQKIAKSGHKPVELSEMMYSSPEFDRWSKWYEIKTVVKGKKSWQPVYNVAAGLLDEPKGVASCKTCQELMPMMLCDKDKAC